MPAIHELVAIARHRLRDAGIADAEADMDARVLAEHVLQWDPAQYFANLREPASTAFADAFHATIDRRARREPLAYITGVQEFWGLQYAVSAAVLIPRPESEIIVEACLALTPTRTSVRVADACSGSGCLAISLAHERPDWTVVATDISWPALILARRNAAQHHVADRVRFVETDLLAGVAGPFDVIVANPPYVPLTEMATLAPEVVDHEPRVALLGGPDGLAVIRPLVAQAAPRLSRDGLLIFEFGFGQADAVRDAVQAEPALELLDLRRDLQGIPRTAIARRVA